MWCIGCAISMTAASPSEGLASVNGDMPFGILFVPTPRLWISNPALTWRAWLQIFHQVDASPVPAACWRWARGSTLLWNAQRAESNDAGGSACGEGENRNGACVWRPRFELQWDIYGVDRGPSPIAVKLRHSLPSKRIGIHCVRPVGFGFGHKPHIPSRS